MPLCTRSHRHFGIVNYAIEFLTIMVANLTHLHVSLVTHMYMFNTPYEWSKTVEIRQNKAETL